MRNVDVIGTLKANTTLAVTGATTLNGATSIANTLSVSQNIVANSNLIVAGNTATTTLNASGQTTLSSVVISGAAVMAVGLDVAGPTKITNTTNASSTSTGALTVAGGLGVAKDVYIGGALTVTNTAVISGDLYVTGEMFLTSNVELVVSNSAVGSMRILDDLILVSGAKTTGGIIPKVTNIDSLGSPALKFDQVYANTFNGSLSGNANTASALATGRAINGVAFNGTTNITIANTPVTSLATNAKFPLALIGANTTSIVSGTLYPTNYVTDISANPNIGTVFATHFDITSDERLKTNIKPIEGATNIVENLRGVSFERISQPNITEYGVIAQEIEKILPHIVNSDNEFKTVNMTQIIGILIESVKELSSRLKILEEK